MGQFLAQLAPQFLDRIAPRGVGRQRNELDRQLQVSPLLDGFGARRSRPRARQSSQIATLLLLQRHARVRRVERALIGEYRRLVEQTLGSLGPTTYARAVQLAELPDMIRGYEQIKLRSIERFRAAASVALEA